MHTSVFLALGLACAASAAPAPAPNAIRRQAQAPAQSLCDVTDAIIPLPEGAAEANLTVPEGLHPSFVFLGIGSQNYTCAGGNFSVNEAVATLIDVSCSVNTSVYHLLTPLASQSPWQLWDNGLPAPYTGLEEELHLGTHYYQLLPGRAAESATSPVFDFRATGKGDFIAGGRVGLLPSPTGPTNVAWVKLDNLEGSLAKTLFRTETYGGVPPATCNDGEKVNIPYSAIYWLFN